MALEGALSALGGRGPRVPLPSAALSPDEQAADTENEQNPAVRAELEKEMARPNLHPVARRVLQDYFASSAAPQGAPDEMALSGALNALSAPVEKPAALPIVQTPNPLSRGEVIHEAAKKTVGPVDLVKATGSMIAAPGAAIAGGYEGMWSFAKNLAGGKSLDEAATEAARVVNERQRAVAFEPDTEGGKKLSSALSSDFNPLNWPTLMAKKYAGMQQGVLLKAADKLQENYPQLADTIRKASAPLAAGTEAAWTAAPMLATNMESLNQPISLGAKQVAQTPISAIAGPVPTANTIPNTMRAQTGAAPLSQVAAGQPATAAAAVAPPLRGGGPTGVVSSTPPPRIDLGLKLPEAGTAAAAVEAAPVKGGLPVAVQGERAAVLARVGIKKAWKSAITGDVLEGATNAQTARFDQPAGVAAREQFLHETQALENAASDVAAKAGGTLGTGETASFARGAKIAEPFDGLRAWFDKTESALYKLADKKTKGLPVVSAEPVETLLNDRSFKNTVMAQDKGYLLNAVNDQLALFKENNAAGLTVQNAEQFRQWLNQQWTHENSAIIGRIKTAVDKAVTQAAGEDVYSSSRAMHILKKDTLENPKGIAKLMDVDPKNPINRATSIEKIPQTIERLPVEQFKNVIDTLRKKMPPELKAQAQAAEAEIKAHFVQNLLDAATPNTKTKSPFWNNRKVNNFLATNEEKMSYLFSPGELAQLADIRAAGNIISVDAAYPGAAAQAANAAKQGLMSRVISPLATGAGGAIGTFTGSILGAPVQGGAAGAMLGRAAGERMSAAAAERAALKGLQKRMTPISGMVP